ncbi:MAG: class I tRNA ligase family protein [Bacteroidia bacterium]|nr:class I tRNA ligase family protein [Bacteroidia bacterium]
MIQGVSQYYYEIRVRADVKEHFDKRDKILRIKKKEIVLYEIKIPKREDWSGYNIYCNYQCKLDFAFVDSSLGHEIPTTITDGLATANFVKEVSINGETKFAHTLLEKWLRMEPHFRPIIITDFPLCAFWHYENKEWQNFSREKVNQSEPLWLTRPEVEKMSKSRINVVTPDNYDYPIWDRDKNNFEYYFKDEDLIKAREERTEYGIIEKYGADCFRMYEMFLGPLEQSKPWNTNGITGVFNFLKKFWKLFDEGQGTGDKGQGVAPTKAELKTLHKTIKKIKEDIERYSFNTCISTFMICVNELTDWKCSKREILEPLAILISPFAPHIAEELWEKLGHIESVTFAKFPPFEKQYLVEDTFAYPVSFNGKTRFNLELPLSLTKEEVEREVMTSDEAKKFLQDKLPKKVIVVPGRIVNVVV